MIFITKLVVSESYFIFSIKIWQTIRFDILVVLLFKKLIIFVVVDYYWLIVAAQNLATRYLLNQLREYRAKGLVPSLKELSFQELIYCYCLKKKHGCCLLRSRNLCLNTTQQQVNFLLI